ncbi:MAG TPA: ATP-binding cassette domain-containing protein, partial [Stellaceae bacterium]|nr:ATP-binding cassette domain-containing protein [Stellaceae bacterium]
MRGTERPRAHVVAEAVAKIYRRRDDEVESVRSLSFEVAEGGFISILGPSGCGKSTLLMMVAGLVPASGGRIIVDGKPVDAPRRDTSVVFQTPVLFPWRT